MDRWLSQAELGVCQPRHHTAAGEALRWQQWQWQHGQRRLVHSRRHAGPARQLVRLLLAGCAHPVFGHLNAHRCHGLCVCWLMRLSALLLALRPEARQSAGFVAAHAMQSPAVSCVELHGELGSVSASRGADSPAGFFLMCLRVQGTLLHSPFKTWRHRPHTITSARNPMFLAVLMHWM